MCIVDQRPETLNTKNKLSSGCQLVLLFSFWFLDFTVWKARITNEYFTCSTFLSYLCKVSVSTKLMLLYSFVLFFRVS